MSGSIPPGKPIQTYISTPLTSSSTPSASTSSLQPTSDHPLAYASNAAPKPPPPSYPPPQQSFGASSESAHPPSRPQSYSQAPPPSQPQPYSHSQPQSQTHSQSQLPPQTQTQTQKRGVPIYNTTGTVPSNNGSPTPSNFFRPSSPPSSSASRPKPPTTPSQYGIRSVNEPPASPVIRSETEQINAAFKEFFADHLPQKPNHSQFSPAHDVMDRSIPMTSYVEEIRSWAAQKKHKQVIRYVQSLVTRDDLTACSRCRLYSFLVASAVDLRQWDVVDQALAEVAQLVPGIFTKTYRQSDHSEVSENTAFDLHILHAMIPSQKGFSIDKSTPQQSADILCNLLEVWKNDTEAKDASTPTDRTDKIHMLLAYVHVQMHLYDTACKYIDMVLDHNADSFDIWERKGFLHLQFGDMLTVRIVLEQLRSLSSGSDVHTRAIQILEALMDVSDGQFENAYAKFASLLEKFPDVPEITNNLAICSMYCNKVPEAKDILESLIRRDPSRYITEGLVHNLCALYSISSCRPAVKRAVLERIIDMYAGSDFDKSCLK